MYLYSFQLYKKHFFLRWKNKSHIRRAFFPLMLLRYLLESLALEIWSQIEWCKFPSLQKISLCPQKTLILKREAPSFKVKTLYSPRLCIGFHGKESASHTGDLGPIPGMGRFPGEGNGTPLQYSCLGNPMHRRAWQAPVCGVTKALDTT